jgi:ribonuclease Z
MESDAQRAADTFHCTAKQAAEIARISGVKNLLLGHFSSRYLDLSEMLAEAQTVFANSILSEEGNTYPILSHHE